jgi:hypothetical protein
MSIIDTTQVDVSAKNYSPASQPATTPEAKPAGDGGNGGEKPAAEARPEASDLISNILDRHGLSSPEELAEFVDRIAERDGVIGDHDPEELLKAKTTLDAYQRDWAKQEQEKLKAAETPDETIARLERDAAERDNRSAKAQHQRRQAEAAKRAVKVYSDVISGAVQAEKNIPAEYVPFIKEFLGVGSPVNDVNIQDRAAVKKMATGYGVKRMMEFEQVVIKRYRDGKAAIPVVPSSATETAPVDSEKKPKNLSEARTMFGDSLKAMWAKK